MNVVPETVEARVGGKTAGPGLLMEHASSTGGEDNTQGSATAARSIRLPPCRAPKLDMVSTQRAPPAKLPPRRASQAVSSKAGSSSLMVPGDDLSVLPFIPRYNSNSPSYSTTHSSLAESKTTDAELDSSLLA